MFGLSKNKPSQFLLGKLYFFRPQKSVCVKFLPPRRQSESHFRNRRCPINDAACALLHVLHGRVSMGGARNALIQRETDACQNGG